MTLILQCHIFSLMCLENQMFEADGVFRKATNWRNEDIVVLLEVTNELVPSTWHL